MKEGLNIQSTGHGAPTGQILGARFACDSLVALGNSTADGSVLFGKNSDRPAGECQPLVQVLRRRYAPGTMLRCQYVEIPQVAETAAMIGSQPFWLWGFEHGLNDHGVAIGNHTVFTKEPLAGQGLIGMDLVRLGLERASSARGAVEVITDLVEKYGQGGSGHLDKHWPYHNSFLVADRREAYLLETSDRHWALRQVSDVASASNHLTIGQDWQALSPGAIDHAIEAGWWRNGDQRFDFAAAYRDTVIVPEVVSSGRYRRTCELLFESRGRIDPGTLRRALRDHYDGPVFHPGRTPDDERFFCVCRHDPLDNTTASMIVRLPAGDNELTCYWGCLGSPCVGVFLPYYLQGELPAIVARGGKQPADDSPWWRFRKLLRLVEEDFKRYTPKVRAVWDEFEQKLVTKAGSAEAEALTLRNAGDESSAAALLSRFMAGNVELMLEKLSQLIRELGRS